MLRRRIMLISCAALLVSLAVSAFVIYRVCFDTLHREALNTAYAEAHEKTVAFDAFASSVKGELGKAEAKYYFESLGDSYTVCLREGAELYNRTVISSDELMAGEYQRYNDMEYRECRAAGRHVLVFHCDGMQSTELYRIADITYIYEKGERLGLFMLFVPAAVAAVCLVVLFILLRRMLSPLRELSASACAVAAGDYGKRVRAVSHDELGQLARDFNTMAQAVEEHTSELVDSQQKKTMFIGALTHELKTPLTAISGYAQILRDARLSEDEREEATEYIYEQACRLDRLSKKLMRLLKLEHDNTLEMTELDIYELLEAAVRVCTRTAEERGITLCISDARGVIVCERELMCECLVNLIDNAIKASPRGAEVLLFTDDEGIKVRDFGCGIESCDIPKLCEPFYTADASRSSKNSGLGLALVEIILRRHEMRLTVDSCIGEGSTFCICGENYRRP